MYGSNFAFLMSRLHNLFEIDGLSEALIPSNPMELEFTILAFITKDSSLAAGAESAKLDEVIQANLADLGYGDQEGTTTHG